MQSNDIKYYLNPVSIDISDFKILPNSEDRLWNIDINRDISPITDISIYDIAIVGLPEDRNSLHNGCKNAPNEIRKQLYKLFKPYKKIRICDLGDVKPGNQINDTYFAISDVIHFLLQNKLVPIILGGSQDLMLGIYRAYNQLQKLFNITQIDSKFNIGNASEDFYNESYLSKLIIEKSKYLFNFSNIGYQSYLVSPDEIELMEKFYFDTYRLGIVRSNLAEIEPVIRDTNIFSLNISAIRNSDAPGCAYSSPNGFFGDEACQLARYAGMSDKTTSFGIFDVNPLFDRNNITSALSAQLIWFFIQGFYQRIGENPEENPDNFTKFIVYIHDTENKLTFYKSPWNERWWVEVSSNEDNNKIYYAACSYTDYQKACKNEIPEIWWKSIKKLNC